MNTLVIAQNYPPSVSGGAVAAKKMAEAIKIAGHSVTVITTENAALTHGEVLFRNSSGIDIIESKWDKRAAEIPFSVLRNITRKKSNLNQRAICGWLRVHGKRYYRHLLRVLPAKLAEIDLIISICYPFYNHIIASTISHTYGIQWNAVYFDPFYSSLYYDFGEKCEAITKFERDILSSAQRICVLPCEEGDYRKLLGDKDNRLNCFDFPIEFPNVYHGTNKRESEKHVFLYTGTLYKDRREPYVLFSLWRQYKKNTG